MPVRFVDTGYRHVMSEGLLLYILCCGGGGEWFLRPKGSGTVCMPDVCKQCQHASRESPALTVGTVHYITPLKAAALGSPITRLTMNSATIPMTSHTTEGGCLGKSDYTLVVWFAFFTMDSALAGVARVSVGVIVLGFGAGTYTRGVWLRFTPLLRLKRCHARDPMAFLSSVHTVLPVDTDIAVQTLKASTLCRAVARLPMNSVTIIAVQTLKASTLCRAVQG
jgi:hypothetical protein